MFDIKYKILYYKLAVKKCTFYTKNFRKIFCDMDMKTFTHDEDDISYKQRKMEERRGSN
ncbi:hypothetical protein CbC4_2091 [Clostridium botulinum BKT015925]|uniref:hypothetical protein n=1 Tax=Clostridium botulinum TaxID=1491 RepID=UPI00020756FB|nr:hypothetical protein [Clostridium botulinum]AEB76758.1 hypothetical protein CbC4_2091 [Clostridium botulinum BKT015925]